MCNSYFTIHGKIRITHGANCQRLYDIIAFDTPVIWISFDIRDWNANENHVTSRYHFQLSIFRRNEM